MLMPAWILNFPNKIAQQFSFLNCELNNRFFISEIKSITLQQLHHMHLKSLKLNPPKPTQINELQFEIS